MAMLPNYKDIVSLIKKGSTIEAQEKIIELRESALELQEENIKLKERIKDLEQQVKKRNNVVWEEPLYWLQDGEKKEGPFCAKCYDTENKMVRAYKIEQGHWHCKACDNAYYDDTYDSTSSYIEVVKRESWLDGY